jgi:hypothetical protein
MLRQLNDLKEKHNLRRTVHLAQSKGEVAQVKKYAGCTPAEYLEKHDWLGADVVGAHWTYCTDSDVALLARHGVHMAHCAANSSRRGPHTAPVAAILDAGVNVCLGTDNMTEDMLQAMKIGSIVHRGSYGGGVKPPPQDLLDAATRNGALSLGAANDIGSIEQGKKADLAVLNLQDACMVPRINLVSNLVHYGHQGMVESVMVDGEFLMRDGKILCLDEQDVLRNAQASHSGRVAAPAREESRPAAPGQPAEAVMNMEKILVINPNSTEVVTRGIDEACAPLRMAGGPAIECVTLKEGPPGIETQQHVDGIVAPLLKLVREREAEYAAFVIACYSDPGLHSVREATRKPVLGISNVESSPR